MFAFEAGYNLGDEKNTKLMAGIDMTSGNDTTTGGDWEAYNNLYYTGHKFRGTMDYFSGSIFEGLTDIYVGASTTITDGWNIGATFHMFSSSEDYVDFNGDLTSDVGTELDINISTSRVAGVKLDFVISTFSAKDSFAGSTDHDSGLEAYGTATIDF